MSEEHEYKGPERRRMDAVFHELDKRLLQMEIAIRALQERVDYIHKRNKERDDAIVTSITKLNEAYWGNGKDGVVTRVQKLEDMRIIFEKEADDVRKGLADFKRLLFWAVGIITTMLGILATKVM